MITSLIQLFGNHQTNKVCQTKTTWYIQWMLSNC